MRLEDHPRWQWKSCMPVDTGNGIVSPLAFTTNGGSHLRLANGMEIATRRASFAAAHRAAEGFLRAMLDEAVAALNERKGWRVRLEGVDMDGDPQDVCVMLGNPFTLDVGFGRQVSGMSTVGHFGTGPTRGERLYDLVGQMWALLDEEATP